MRNLLDPLYVSELRDPFWDILARLEHAGILAGRGYTMSGPGQPRWLCALDGTQYFHSTQVHCANCATSVWNGVTHYAHSVLVAALVRPVEADVLVLEPAFIQTQDGSEKQDCERAATRRWIERNAERLKLHKYRYSGR